MNTKFKVCIFRMYCFNFINKWPKQSFFRLSWCYLIENVSFQQKQYCSFVGRNQHFKKKHHCNIYNNNNNSLSCRQAILERHQHFRTFSNESTINSDEISAEKLEELLLSDAKYQECILEYYNIPNTGQRVFLIQPDIKWGPQKSLSSIKNQLEESIALVKTLRNWKVVGHKVVSCKKPQKMQIFGKGNFEELTEQIRKCPAVSAIFLSIDMLNGQQWSYLQNIWNIPVYDRYTIIMQIFKEHAKTKESKLQVALAEVPYIRSRLVSIHKDTQSYSQGAALKINYPGEMYLEQRYKFLQEQEMKLKLALQKVKRQRALLRKNRLKRQIPIIAVVGYTNSGKTSLIKALTDDAGLEPVDQLFATLDVTAHAGILANRMKVIYMDTVGFISDIPTKLIDAFAATLEDAMIADLLIHVRDISHDDTEAQNKNVHQTLRTMVSSNQLKNMIEVNNKVDLLPTGHVLTSTKDGAIFTNAVNGQGIANLKMCVQKALLSFTVWKEKKFRIFQGSPLLQWLEKEATILSAVPDENQENLIVTVLITDIVYAKLKANFKKSKQKKYPS